MDKVFGVFCPHTPTPVSVKQKTLSMPQNSTVFDLMQTILHDLKAEKKKIRHADM